MNNQSKKMRLLASAPMPKALLAMGIPTMIGMLVNACYNLADVYFVGGLGERQTAALSVSYPLGQVIVGSGAASVISRLLGRGDVAHAERTASTAVYGGITLGAAVIIFFMAFLHPLLKLLGATESVMPFAVSYARIYVASCIFSVFNVTMNGIAASEGSAKTTMCALLAGAVLNIALDPLFIYALDLGVSGAALATAISQMVSFGVYMAYILRKKSLFRFRIADCAFTAETLSGIFKIGAPTLAFQILTGVSISLTNNAAGVYGDSAIAGMGIVTRLISLGSLSVFGFVKGFQPVAGFVLGSCRQGICFIPAILLLPSAWGLNGILYAQSIADALSAAVTVCIAIPLHRKLKRM